MERPPMLTALTKNYEKLKSVFKWSDKRVIYLMAKVFIGQEEQLDEVILKKTRQELSDQTGLFSQLNGVVRDMIGALMVANKKDSEKDIALLVSSYRDMKQLGFSSSSYTYFAAYLLQFTKQCDKVEVAQRGIEIIAAIKQTHPWITGVEDYPLAISLAQSDKIKDYTPTQVASMVEFYYQTYRQFGFRDRNQIQFAACSTVLLLGEQNSHFVYSVEELAAELNTQGIKTRPLHYNGIIILAYLKMTGELNDLSELNNYLVGAKEEIKLFLDRDFRETMGISLFIENYSKNLSASLSDALIVNLNQLIIQEQVMMAATMAAVVTASSSD